MSNMIRHILVLLISAVVHRLQSGGQFITQDSVKAEVLNLLHDAFRNPSVLRFLEAEIEGYLDSSHQASP